LVEFLFRYGRPVSSFDLAEFVQGTLALRRRVQPAKGSSLDALIEKTLLEFNSLHDEKKPVEAKEEAPKAAPFEDIGKWAEEIVAPVSEQASGGEKQAPVAPVLAEPSGEVVDEEADVAAKRPRRAGVTERDSGPGKNKKKRKKGSGRAAQDEHIAAKGDGKAVQRGAERGTGRAVAAAGERQAAGSTAKTLMLVAAVAVLIAAAYLGGLLR
jgi:hypothetical protein